MTAERRLLLELHDLRALTFECLHPKCGIRLSMSPDAPNLHRLMQCPACSGIWLADDVPESNMRTVTLGRMLLAIASLRAKPLPGVRVLFEFDEPAR